MYRLLAILCLLSGVVVAQGGNTISLSGTGAPTGGCAFNFRYVDNANGNLYDCFAGSWNLISGGGGGAVSSVFTRTGAVTAQTGDYTVSQVTGAAPIASPTFTGTVIIPSGASIAGFAPLASPALTGTPTAPTASAGTNTTQLATTQYTTTAIANAIAAVNPAVAVQAATAAVLPNSPTYSNGASGIGATLTTVTLNTALVVDGYTPVLNDRILVKNQASSFQNGVYTVTQVAAVGLAWILTRALDFDQPSDMNNTGAIPVINGTVNAVTQWVISSTVNTVGTDAVTFAQFSSNPATLGILVNAQSGNYTLNTSPDRAAYLKFSGGTTATLTLCQITSTCANNYPFVVQNLNSGNLTITANAADKIDNSATGGSITVLPNFAAFIYQDSSSAPGNWWSIQVPNFAAFGSTCSNGVTWSTSTGIGCLATLIANTRGGTGLDTSASTGVAQVASGTWSVSTALANGTTATTQAANSNDTKAATDAYADTVIAKPLLTGNAASNTVRVSSSNFTTTSATLVAITGLSFTLPANTAANYHITCDVNFSESTGSTVIFWGIQDVTTAPTSMQWGYVVNTNTTVFSSNVVTAITSTTATDLNGAGFTPSGTGQFGARIWGTVEQPSGSASVLQLMVRIASGVTFTANRSSTCTMTTTTS